MKKIDQEVKCPSCGWHPHQHSTWECMCGNRWNIFSTSGRCPNCTRVWKKIKCGSDKNEGCGEYSNHLDWYGNLNRWLRRQLRSVPVTEGKTNR